QKQQAAPEEYGGKELVLQMAQAVAHHADEPQEGDPCERQQTQRQRNGACSFFEPRAGIRWIGRDGKPDKNIAAREQHREEYSRKRGSARCLESLSRQVGLSARHSAFTSQTQHGRAATEFRNMSRKDAKAAKGEYCHFGMTGLVLSLSVLAP